MKQSWRHLKELKDQRNSEKPDVFRGFFIWDAEIKKRPSRDGRFLFCLCPAADAAEAAAKGLGDNRVEVFLTVVVGDFLAGADFARGMDVDAVLGGTHLAVGPAAMVGVARDVRTLRTQDGLAVLQVKKIFSADSLGFGIAGQTTKVFDDEASARDGVCSIKPQSARAAADFNGVSRWPRFGVRHNE